MRGLVYNNNQLAGYLEKDSLGEYTFEYEPTYFSDQNSFAISLTLPKSTRIHRSRELFPFFFGMLSEGINKDIQCRLLRIDENDYFRRLLLTTSNDTIGAITVKPEEYDL